MRVRTALLALLLALDAAVLFVVPELSAPRAERVDLAPVAYLQRHLGDSRFFSMGPLQPNYGSYFGLGSLNINDFPPMDYAHFVHFRMDPAVNPTLFVGNFGGWRPRTAPTPTWELVRHLDGYRAAGLRYVLAPVGHRLPQSPRTFTLVRRTPTTWIYRVAGTSSYFHARGCRVNWSGRENAHVSCRHASTLVRLETWLPGWSAVVDGHPTVVRRTDKLFQAVEVPAGSHRVSFAFAPTGIHWALLALLTGIALACTPWLPRGLEWGRGRFRRS